MVNLDSRFGLPKCNWWPSRWQIWLVNTHPVNIQVAVYASVESVLLASTSLHSLRGLSRLSEIGVVYRDGIRWEDITTQWYGKMVKSFYLLVSLEVYSYYCWLARAFLDEPMSRIHWPIVISLSLLGWRLGRMGMQPSNWSLVLTGLNGISYLIRRVGQKEEKQVQVKLLSFPYETKRQQRKRPNQKDFRFASSVRTIRIQGRKDATGLEDSLSSPSS